MFAISSFDVAFVPRFVFKWVKLGDFDLPDRSCLHLNDLTWESHGPSSKFQGDKPLEPLFGG